MAEESQGKGDHQEGNGMAERSAIVIVTRNGLALTKAAIKSALAQDVSVDLLVVDNDSTDGTRAWLKSKTFPVIYADKQWSLAKCWNVALKTLWRQGKTSALACNNDIVLRPDAIRMLLSHGGEFVTCVSVDSLDRIGVPGDRNIEDLCQTERRHPDFSVFLMHKSVTDKIGWFDEDCYPAYTEDSLWHVRMHRAGINAVCIDLPFYHVGASTLKNSDPAEAERIRRGADANRQRFLKKYKCLPGSKAYEQLFT